LVEIIISAVACSRYLTQVEIPVTTADLYFPLEPRPLLVFIDGIVHLRRAQMVKDEELAFSFTWSELGVRSVPVHRNPSY